MSQDRTLFNSMPREKSSAHHNILSLGDSYTIGEGVVSDERWPVQMVRMLRERGHPFSEPEIIAQTGWTTDELQSAVDASQKLHCEYSWVTLLIGVNNQYRGRDREEFRHEFRGLLRDAIRFACNRAHRVIVLSIPDWGVTPFAKTRDRQKIAIEIDHYNQILRDETMAHHSHYVDVTDIARGQQVDNSKMLVDDELHPSGSMYKIWAESVSRLILLELENPST